MRALPLHRADALRIISHYVATCEVRSHRPYVARAGLEDAGQAGT